MSWKKMYWLKMLCDLLDSFLNISLIAHDSTASAKWLCILTQGPLISCKYSNLRLMLLGYEDSTVQQPLYISIHLVSWNSTDGIKLNREKWKPVINKKKKLVKMKAFNFRSRSHKVKWRLGNYLMRKLFDEFYYCRWHRKLLWLTISTFI